MTAARLAARCVELLGAVEGPIAVAAARPVIDAVTTRVAVANGDAAVGGAVCVFLDERIVPQVREATLDALAARLPTGASLVVVDHNQPRAAWRRLIGVLALALRGHGPARARHPVAREVRDHGFTIERLRLDEGERVQLVLGAAALIPGSAIDEPAGAASNASARRSAGRYRRSRIWLDAVACR